MRRLGRSLLVGILGGLLVGNLASWYDEWNFNQILARWHETEPRGEAEPEGQLIVNCTAGCGSGWSSPPSCIALGSGVGYAATTFHGTTIAINSSPTTAYACFATAP